MKGRRLITLLGSICLILVLAALPFMAACAAPTPPPVTPPPVTPPPTPTPAPPIEIKIGLVNPMSGPVATGAELGADCALGAKIAIDMINDKGGVLGKYEVKYWVGDDRGEAEGGATEAERLISLYGVQVIIGSWHSDATMAMGEVCERHKVVNWIPVAMAEEIIKGRGYSYVFRAGIDTPAFGAPAVDLIKENADKLGKPVEEITLAIIHEDGAYGTGIADAAEERAKEYGIPVVLREPYYGKATDLSSLVLKIKEANPDVVIQGCRPPDLILFIKQALDLGLKMKGYMASAPGLTFPGTYKALGSVIEGIPATNFQFIRSDSKVLDTLDAEVAAASREFIERFTAEREYGPWGSSFSAFGTTWILLTDIMPRAITKYGDTSPENLAKAILETDLPANKVPMGFRVKFHPLGHEKAGQNMYVTAAIQQWFEGELYNVWPPEVADKPLTFPLEKGHPLAR